MSNTIPAFDVKKNTTRGYAVNDTVICEVLEVIPDTDKMSVGMKGSMRHTEDPTAPPLGLIHADDYPNMYKYVQRIIFSTHQFKISYRTNLGINLQHLNNKLFKMFSSFTKYFEVCW